MTKSDSWFKPVWRMNCKPIESPAIRIILYPNDFVGRMMATIYNKEHVGGDTVARVYPRENKK